MQAHEDEEPHRGGPVDAPAQRTHPQAQKAFRETRTALTATVSMATVNSTLVAVIKMRCGVYPPRVKVRRQLTLSV